MNNQHQANNSSTGQDDTSRASDKTQTLESASSDAMATVVMVLIDWLIQPPLFPLGQVVATPGALDLLDRTGTNASRLLARHQRGDWGTVCANDVAENNRSIKDGERVLSAYELGRQHERLWIITERDRSVTTLLLPQEY